jgi:class 3 adenylate cyclase
VGTATRERLGAEFSFVSLGDRALRNVDAPVPVFRLALPEAAPAVTA